jgi:isochorismate hydrolase
MSCTNWDEEKVYDEKIAPLMTQIINVCKEHEIPIVCTFQYGWSEEDDALLCTTVLTQFERTSAAMRALAKRHGPSHPVVLSEIVQTREDGSKLITITRVS